MAGRSASELRRKLWARSSNGWSELDALEQQADRREMGVVGSEEAERHGDQYRAARTGDIARVIHRGETAEQQALSQKMCQVYT